MPVTFLLQYAYAPLRQFSYWRYKEVYTLYKRLPFLLILFIDRGSLPKKGLSLLMQYGMRLRGPLPLRERFLHMEMY